MVWVHTIWPAGSVITGAAASLMFVKKMSPAAVPGSSTRTVNCGGAVGVGVAAAAAWACLAC